MAGAAPAVAVANDAVALGFDPARLRRHLLNPKTVDLMHANHTGDKYRRDTTAFGLGFWVNEDSGFYPELVNKGAHGWGSAYFPQYLVDPEKNLVAIFMTQLRPTGGLDLSQKFKVLSYQALID